MLNIGPGELILVLVIVLIIFGPGKLPDVGNAIGKGLREFRKASSELEDSIRGEPVQATRQEQSAPSAGSANAAADTTATGTTPSGSAGTGSTGEAPSAPQNQPR